MHAHTHQTRGPPHRQQRRMTPDNATHAGYTTAATRTPQHEERLRRRGNLTTTLDVKITGAGQRCHSPHKGNHVGLTGTSF